MTNLDFALAFLFCVLTLGFVDLEIKYLDGSKFKWVGWISRIVQYKKNKGRTKREKVVHGYWILKDPCGQNTGGLHCSVCNKIPKSLCVEDFCPNCGAKMDGGNEDGKT